ncbi:MULTISPECIES: ribonuclease R [Clostridium]|uniref:ribonuclease R n=1 Tax=Clostridium TaxID=1485 RepID=UPI000DA030BC|nr:MULTISPECIES: ribonuclease R [Clostridium]MDB2084453.1 ribonuclease R [Clostridium paraputrificum]MDB2117099.1 ribonuclease R [Clostridium paraputrificum]MDB2120426.1 ribonuclease R [Clostridium paraputrificum]MDU2754935.1 ribonuclease R [Clostridium sp.]MDU2900785.1 ribonuclease R [Clostridium sp.]
MGIKDTLLEFMREEAYRPMDIQELVSVFDINPDEYRAFKKTLKTMEKEGLIFRTKKDKFALPERLGLITGKLQAHAKGFGFLIPEVEGEKDVFIPSSFINGAMNGDRILVQITREDKNGKKREGEVIQILERGNTKIIGVYEDSKNFGFVIAEDTRISQDIFISKKDRNGAKDGDVVVVEITKWPEKRRSPEGVVKEVLGQKGDKGLDILTIIKKYGLPEEFPPKVQAFTAGIDEEIPLKEYKRRKDLRDVRMVTIDGEDAKDLDDAVSIERLDNGRYRLGVHIADVSHYVREKNPLDKEALKRGTSVYLIDRVIPMLPKKLSNGICSLNPKVDRLTLSCIMVIDGSGKVLDHEIVESVIRTNERMTYTDVTKILKDNDPELSKRYDYLLDDFKAMEELCNILYKKRTKRGAIDFEFEESKIILNEFGKPIDIKPYEREIANRIIEEFMLVCNETVAEHMFWSHLPFVYRIHEDPDEEKLEKFREFIYNLGYIVKWNGEVKPRNLQEILEKVRGKKEETVVSTLLLRSMMRAKYSPECVGHFGLAAKYYCHFTSPIRRYPDLQIHRIIKEFINGKIDDDRSKKLTALVDYAARQSSETENIATEAEREVDDLKKAEYMLDRIGEEFEGIVSSVTSFGMFVELPNTIEGLIHITALDDDYYIYDENHLCLMGERTKKIYRLGDFVKVRCSKVDIPNREIYFDMVEDEYIREEIKASKELAEKISEVKQELKEEDVEETDDNIL